MVDLDRKMFFILHELICQKCFGKDYKKKTNQIPDYQFYGYDFNKKQTHLVAKSIKGITQISGRKLRDLKNAYNLGETSFIINDKTIKKILRFLAFENLANVFDFYFESNALNPQTYNPPIRIIRTKLDKTDNFEYDLYIAHPFLSIEKEVEQLNTLKTGVLSLIAKLKSKWNIKTYYGPSMKKVEIAIGYEPGDILREQFINLPKSRAYLFIFPFSDTPLNSVILQAGWAVFSGRITLISYQDINMLPSLLRKGEVLDHIKLRPFHNGDFDPNDIEIWMEAQELFRHIKPQAI